MADLNEKTFLGLSRWMAPLRRFGDRWLGGWVGRLTPETRRETTDWAADADWAQLQQEPLRARALLRLAVLLVVLLLIWAALAQVDEVARGEGKVVPTRQVQVIQSVDGGVVDEILVREGQVVELGQVLLRVDPTRFKSNLGESRASQLALQAKALRLKALTRGGAFNPSDELMRDAPDIVAHERRLYESKRDEISTQVSMAQNQLSQRQQELNEVRARKAQAEQGLASLQKELNATRPLVRTGAVSEVEVLKLEREQSRLRGDRDQASAQISRVQASISEAQRRIEEVQLNARNLMSAELSETMSRLSALNEGDRALADKVAKADIKSPVRGTIKRLLVNTVGGVVQPGKEVVEVVPLDEALILEAQITPRDIAFLRPGLKATVKFTAYDFAIYGGLDAVVENISADSVVDQKGNAFYLVRLRTDKALLDDKLPIIPGMVAQVDILTGKKSVLSYLLKPVLRAKANALSER
ncbi:HlyD family type I secretion periplasmic adaptor subunit [Malikia spinosa]|uniref:Membrane fusion protein (MFP) family protein n=1 Tax=Malikia spinosa TaxID=86180 RepID=A0A2S9KGD8_9BURK|nr:HlyD family type I secretion periplasmic adaptor subunit [Malikia spinosa]OGB72281.1 MAG: secretion protein HylD [Burkholderiales bacterium RIFOXYC12_FULL_65_23]PRD69509.1 HlyD family type I secretion periplasmic adaptor subunit [Malikia spinosa]